MLKISYYKEKVTDVAELNTIRCGIYYITDGALDGDLYIRGDAFRDVKTRELIFCYGCWKRIIHIGYKYITLEIDGKEVKCEPLDSFDVKVDETKE